MEEKVDEKDDLISVFHEAARIAQTVPEHFRDAAFQRALDVLLAQNEMSASPNAPPPSRRSHETITPTLDVPSAGSTLNRLLHEVDSSAHPEIHDTTNLRDQCLMVLRVMKNEYGVDGLTTTEVNSLLASKFRVKASERGIRRALSEAGRLVDRIPEGKGFRYRIMAAGEQHLTASASNGDQDRSPRGDSTPPAPAPRRHRRRALPAKDVIDSPAPSPSVSTTARKRRDSTLNGVGPSARIRNMIAAGWFASPRTVNDILKEMARLGATYKRTDLTRLMINLVRSGELARNQLADEQGREVWHYSAPVA